jgi:pimeloyl-ACP methyl ester carboxylesterase
MVAQSVGGTVSLSLMLTYPGRVSKVAAVGSPIQVSGLALLVKLSGRLRFAGFLHRIPGLLNSSTKLLCLTDGE